MTQPETFECRIGQGAGMVTRITAGSCRAMQKRTIKAAESKGILTPLGEVCDAVELRLAPGRFCPSSCPRWKRGRRKTGPALLTKEASAERIKRAAKAAGLGTCEEITRAAGVDRRTAGRHLSGQNRIGRAAAKRYAAGLGGDPDWYRLDRGRAPEGVKL